MRIMVVDDNIALAQTTGWMVEAAGHDYITAYTPEEALDRARDYQPHLSILDIGLPRMNGFELCRELKAMPMLTHTKFLAQTGTSSDEYRQSATQAGFDYYIVKPFPLDDLMNILTEIDSRI